MCVCVLEFIARREHVTRFLRNRERIKTYSC